MAYVKKSSKRITVEARALEVGTMLVAPTGALYPVATIVKHASTCTLRAEGLNARTIPASTPFTIIA